jgi:hypothetical protein
MGRLISKSHITPVRISHHQAPVQLKVRSEKHWMMIVFTMMLIELGVIMAYGMSY